MYRAKQGDLKMQESITTAMNLTFSQHKSTPNLDAWLDVGDAELARRVQVGADWLAANGIEADLFVFMSDAETFGHRYQDFVALGVAA